MEEWRGAYRVVVGKPKGKNHLEDPGADGRILTFRRPMSTIFDVPHR